MSGDLTRGERLQIMLSPEELAALDDFRFKQRMPSRAAAVRELFRLGLASVGIKPAGAGVEIGRFRCVRHRPGGSSRAGDGRPAPTALTAPRSAKASARPLGTPASSPRSWPPSTARLKRASSRTISALNASGELPTTMACWPRACSRISGVASARTSASFNRFTIGAGVSFGAISPKNAIQLMSSRPSSPKVGTSGNAATRLSPDSAEAAQLAGLHQFERRRQVVVDHLHLPADGVVQRRPHAAIGHVQDVGAGRELELLAEQMRRPSRSPARRRRACPAAPSPAR